MDILQAIQQAQGGSAVRNLGQQFGLSDDQTAAALSALVPALSAGFQKNMSSQHGLDALMGALGGGQHQRYVEDAATLTRQETVADGNGILGHLFGNKEVSRQVASRAANQTGIGEGVLKSMLPVVAAMMMGTLSKRLNQPGSMQAAPASGSDALIGMLAPMLDANRNGSMVDDVVGMLGKMLGR